MGGGPTLRVDPVAHRYGPQFRSFSSQGYLDFDWPCSRRRTELPDNAKPGV